MSTSIARPKRTVSLLQHSAWDGLFVGLAALQPGVIVLLPHPLTIAVGIWWNSNTISHGFIHNPFFRSRLLNQLFAAYLSVLLGFPHVVWRSRHLAHHANRAPRFEFSVEFIMQSVLIVLLWTALLLMIPWFFLTVYLPGFALGMVLCTLQGHYEHDAGTRSYYGRFYNVLFFNDGYHVEHHAHPRRHWTSLSRNASPSETSAWPPVLRWLEIFSLESLERRVLRPGLLQRFVLSTHARALEKLLRDAGRIEHVGIVGGGLFPRTAIILSELLPDAQLTVIDLSEENLATAAELLPARVECKNEAYAPQQHNEFDLLVFPLSLQGNRHEIYGKPPARLVCVHDWIWRRRGNSQVVSWFLLKRINLVRS